MRKITSILQPKWVLRSSTRPQADGELKNSINKNVGIRRNQDHPVDTFKSFYNKSGTLAIFNLPMISCLDSVGGRKRTNPPALVRHSSDLLWRVSTLNAANKMCQDTKASAVSGGQVQTCSYIRDHSMLN